MPQASELRIEEIFSSVNVKPICLPAASVLPSSPGSSDTGDGIVGVTQLTEFEAQIQALDDETINASENAANPADADAVMQNVQEAPSAVIKRKKALARDPLRKSISDKLPSKARKTTSDG